MTKARVSRRTINKMTTEQTELLRKIKMKHEEILDHENEAEKFRMEERPFPANDASAEADFAAIELIELLTEAEDKGMNTPEFPLVEQLIKGYIVEPAKRLSMAGGSGYH